MTNNEPSTYPTVGIAVGTVACLGTAYFLRPFLEERIGAWPAVFTASGAGFIVATLLMLLIALYSARST